MPPPVPASMIDSPVHRFSIGVKVGKIVHCYEGKSTRELPTFPSRMNRTRTIASNRDVGITWLSSTKGKTSLISIFPFSTIIGFVCIVI